MIFRAYRMEFVLSKWIRRQIRQSRLIDGLEDEVHEVLRLTAVG